MPHEIDITLLSIAERILLAEQLWESVRQQAEAVPVLHEHLEELHRRIVAYQRGEMPPSLPWEEVDAWLGTL